MGQDINKYISNISCAEKFENIITVEHRSNNPKRDFLFCNKIQSKHIPSKPSDTFNMLDELIKKLEIIRNYKVLVIGFAETATALGSYIADNLSSCVYYLQTTREDCRPIKKLIDFEEEHSHATEQYLFVGNDIPEYNYILFIDDEISTGRTILNFIEKLNKNIKFGVASICNWQNEENREKFKVNNIDTFYIISGTVNNINGKMIVNVIQSDIEYISSLDIKYDNNYSTVEIDDTDQFLTERTGRFPNSKKYVENKQRLLEKVKKFIGDSKNILILGTEEFMYTPICVGHILETDGYNVKTHSSSRSSIDVIEDSTGSKERIYRKFKLHSAYDSNREVYIYNLEKYDKVVIISDCYMTSEFMDDTIKALKSVGNETKDICFISMV